MAATYVDVSLEEMDQYLRRAFRVMRPKQGIFGGMYYYDLKLSDKVGVRVFTSIQARTGMGKGRGESAFRVGLCLLGSRFLDKGKQPIAKRTQNWRDNVRNRIEDAIEKYDNEEDKYERLAGGNPNRITPKQIAMIESLIDKGIKAGMGGADIERVSRDAGLPTRKGSPDYEDFTKVQASQFIEAIQIKIAATQKARESGEKPKYDLPEGVATFKMLNSGEWGLRGMWLEEGQSVGVKKRNGLEVQRTVGRVVWQDPSSGLTFAEMDESSRQRYASDGTEDGDEDVSWCS